MAGDFQVTFKTPFETKVAFTEGRFNSEGQKFLADKNKLLSEVVQFQVVAYMSNHGFKRKAVSTGRLLRVTADPKNRYASAFRLGVGVPHYLDTSQAKYWRTIEEGSAQAWKKRPFTSLELTGIFGATLSGWGAKGPRGGPKFTLPGGATGGKFIPILGKNPTFGRNKIPLRAFSPRHQIEAMDAYGWAYRESNLHLESIRAARRYLNIVLGQALRPGRPTVGETYTGD